MLDTILTKNRPLRLVLLACFAILTLAHSAEATTTTELLEKAIYTEETVGDLKGAIQIYEQVMAESEESTNAAAQAQFRIGTCYAKQGQSEEAAAAFQSVLDHYPQATTWVAQAKSRLPGDPELLPVPWGDGDEMHYAMKLPNGLGVGHQVFRVGKVQVEGRSVWECSAWQTVTLNGMLGKSRVLVDCEAFVPIESEWKHSMLGQSEATYGKNEVEIRLASKDQPVTLQFKSPVYDNEQAVEMFRRLPLKEGYQTNVKIIAILMGSEIPIALHVSKIETIEIPAGEFECFRLELSIGQTFWISTDEHRYLVRFEAGGVTADLTAVRAYDPNRSTTIEQEFFTATLPPDWHAYTPSQSEEKEKTRTFIISPKNSVSAHFTAAPLEVAKEKCDSPTACLEKALGKVREHLKEVTLSEEGICTETIAGREAAVMEFEYLDKKEPKTALRIALFGETSAVSLELTAATQDYEALRPAIEEILASLQIQ